MKALTKQQREFSQRVLEVLQERGVTRQTFTTKNMMSAAEEVVRRDQLILEEYRNNPTFRDSFIGLVHRSKL